MLDILGQDVREGAIVALPERVARNESGLRLGIVQSAWSSEAVVETLDSRVIFAKSDQVVVLSRNAVPDDILVELESLLEW